MKNFSFNIVFTILIGYSVPYVPSYYYEFGEMKWVALYQDKNESLLNFYTQKRKTKSEIKALQTHSLRLMKRRGI